MNTLAAILCVLLAFVFLVLSAFFASRGIEAKTPNEQIQSQQTDLPVEFSIRGGHTYYGKLIGAEGPGRLILKTEWEIKK